MGGIYICPCLSIQKFCDKRRRSGGICVLCVPFLVVNVSVNCQHVFTFYIAMFQIEDEPNKIHDQDRQTVKQLIVGLMLKSPEQIQKQVSDIILSLTKYFWTMKIACSCNKLWWKRKLKFHSNDATFGFFLRRNKCLFCNFQL